MRAFPHHPMHDDQWLAPWGLLLAGLLALALAAALTQPARADMTLSNAPQGSLPLGIA